MFNPWIKPVLSLGPFSIYNTHGIKVKTGTIQENNKINIQTISNGIYFLIFENGNSIKFIKK
uniref:T9SS type A sorting domain-containing protein n=1 Tax=Flavobacterium sp. TaxID=239 RepID=UPI00404AD625